MIEEILARIEERLSALGMSATAASRASGLGDDAIRNMRRAIGHENRPGVSTNTIVALAKTLKVSVGWLMSGEGEALALDDDARAFFSDYADLSPEEREDIKRVARRYIAGRQ